MMARIICSIQRLPKTWLSDNSAEKMYCFMGYYVLLAKAKWGQYEEALNIIRECWGGMLDVGAMTFWEDFDIKWMENSVGINKLVPEGKNDIHGDFGKHAISSSDTACAMDGRAARPHFYRNVLWELRFWSRAAEN